MSVDTVLTGGTIVTASGERDAALAIDDGTIVGIGDRKRLPEGDEQVDVSGRLVMPGVVDPHVHVADPFSIDSYETASKAAALGGTTSLIGFAFQAYNPKTDEFDGSHTLSEAVASAKERATESLIDYGFHGAVTRETEQALADLETVVPAGISSIKMFTAYDVGLPNGFINRVFEALADLDGVAVLHTEDGSVCDTLTELFKEQNKGDSEYYPASRPDYAEAMAAEDCVRMALEAGAKYYGIHTSCRKSAEVIEQFREDGSRIRAETCYHYTALDDTVYEEQGNLPMIAPPIRKDDDVEAMFEYLRNGTLDVVSTDHCAYTEESKQVDNWWDSSFGANSLQTGFHVFHDEAVNERGLSYPALVRMVSTAPARIFGLSQKGTLEVGTDADIIVFDPDETWTVDADENESNADFSLYDGWELTGRVKETYVRGERLVEDSELTGVSGHGEFIDRELPDWSV
jgi:dihydropyrimidinase